MIQTYLLCESDEPSVCQLVTCDFHLHGHPGDGTVDQVAQTYRERGKFQLPLWPNYLKPLMLG